MAAGYMFLFSSMISGVLQWLMKNDKDRSRQAYGHRGARFTEFRRVASNEEENSEIRDEDNFVFNDMTGLADSR